MRLSVDIPTLETERLILRGPKPEDEARFVDFFASDRARFIGGNGTRSRGWQAFAVEFGHWILRGYGMWSVTMKGSDTALGSVGCWFPGANPEPEIGWQVYADAEGRGIAFEAAVAARRHAYEGLGWTTAVSYIDPENTRSIALAERLGAVRDADAPLSDGDTPETCLVYRHPTPEALSA